MSDKKIKKTVRENKNSNKTLLKGSLLYESEQSWYLKFRYHNELVSSKYFLYLNNTFTKSTNYIVIFTTLITKLPIL